MTKKKTCLRTILIFCFCAALLMTNLPWSRAAALPRPTVPKNGIISAGMNYNVYLSPEGNVVFSTSSPNTVEWTGIVAVDAGMIHPIGLKADGTVVTDDAKLNLSGWKNIVAVSAGDGFALGLKSDGTVMAAGDNSKGQCKTSGWKNVTAISAGWEHAVALLADGTVVATGDNSFGQCDVSEWTDIIQVSTCHCYTIGLTGKGTVVVAGSPELSGQIGPSGQLSWEGIIAVTAGANEVYGLREDGVVLVFETQNTYDASNPQKQLSWDYPIEITSFDAGYYHLACMEYGGELYFRGGNQCGEGDACRVLHSRGAHLYEKDGSNYICYTCGFTPKFSGSVSKCSHFYSEIYAENSNTINTICNLCGKTQNSDKRHTNLLAYRLTQTEPEKGNYDNKVEANLYAVDYTGVTRSGVNYRSHNTEVAGTFDVEGSDQLECTIIAGSDFDPNGKASLAFYGDEQHLLTLTGLGYETNTKITLPIYDVESLKIICINTSYISSEVSTPQVHLIVDGTLYTS